MTEDIYPLGMSSILAFPNYLRNQMDTLVQTSARQQQITKAYIQALDAHIADLKNGLVDRALEIADFAAQLYVHPTHLSNTIKAVTGQSTCDLYETRLLQAAKDLLLQTDMTIGQIAMQLTYDPSNFTKFFKTYTGLTPKQFRQQEG